MDERKTFSTSHRSSNKTDQQREEEDTMIHYCDLTNAPSTCSGIASERDQEGTVMNRTPKAVAKDANFILQKQTAERA